MPRSILKKSSKHEKGGNYDSDTKSRSYDEQAQPSYTEDDDIVDDESTDEDWDKVEVENPIHKEWVELEDEDSEFDTSQPNTRRKYSTASDRSARAQKHVPRGRSGRKIHFKSSVNVRRDDHADRTTATHAPRIAGTYITGTGRSRNFEAREPSDYEPSRSDGCDNAEPETMYRRDSQVSSRFLTPSVRGYSPNRHDLTENQIHILMEHKRQELQGIEAFREAEHDHDLGIRYERPVRRPDSGYYNSGYYQYQQARGKYYDAPKE